MSESSQARQSRVRVLNEMERDRVTDKEGHWYLRHAVLADDSHAFLLSTRAPKGTRGADLEPKQIEFMPSDDWDGTDPIPLDVADLHDLMRWP
jgi:hypothetical protein